MTRRKHRTVSGYVWRLAAIVAIASLIFVVAGWRKDSLAVDNLQLEASAAILIDAKTGEVLYSKNADQPLPPASMSKMMTEIIVLDYIYEKKGYWNDKVTASAYAAEVPGVAMGLLGGDRVSMRELFDAMTVHSANDAAVALAEHVAGTEEAFVTLMNDKARKIGLSEDAIFGNASGLSRLDILSLEGSSHARDTLLSAKDTAMLAGYLIGKYPEVLEVTSKGSVNVSTQGQALLSTNQMLANRPFAYRGNDGLKTGYTHEAGYCFTGTVKRDGRRLISVVMGTESKEARFMETTRLYEMAFQPSRSSFVKSLLAF